MLQQESWFDGVQVPLWENFLWGSSICQGALLLPCTFDFKTYDRQNLAKQNPLVAGDKLHTRI